MPVELSRNRLILATAGTMLALLLAALDQTVVGTALPRIVAELGGVNQYWWVITAYLIFSTSMTAVSGRLGDLFGRKLMLLLGMTGFMVASVLCGRSQDMLELILFRGLQGFFAGFLFGNVFSVVADLYPPQRRGKIQGLFGGVFGVASILGPLVGGLLTDTLGWRWVFYVNIPVGLLAVALVFWGMPFARSRASWRSIDFAGAFALLAFMASLMIALASTRDHGWTAPEVDGPLVLAGALLVVFVIIEVRSQTPILPLELFRNRTFSAAIVIAFFTAFGMFATIIYGPLVFQGVLGVSPTSSGTLTAPMSIAQIAASYTTGMLMQRIVRYRYLGTIGLAIMVAGLLLMTQLTVTSTRLEATRNMIMIGFGLGSTFPLCLLSAQNVVPRQLVGVASSQVQFFRSVGGTIAVAVLGTILTQRLPGNVAAEIDRLHLPPATATLLTSQGGGNPQTLFDPQNVARARAALPPGTSQLFDSVLEATRLGLAATLHDMFLFAAVIVVVALVATLFLREAPMRAAKPTVQPVSTPVGPAAMTVVEGTSMQQAVDRIAAKQEEEGPPGESRAARYVAGIRDLADEISQHYEAELKARDDQISELTQRAEVAEQRGAELEVQVKHLEDDLVRHEAGLRRISEEMLSLAGRSEPGQPQDGATDQDAGASPKPQPIDHGVMTGTNR
jgi:EmrB/QacA subfamily drug resistance transporter